MDKIKMLRPHTTVILAMSADGKIADTERSSARFSSRRDLQHLEEQISRMDGVVFGATTLQVYQTTRAIIEPKLLKTRSENGQTPQPVQIVCTASGKVEPHWRFFSQDVPHWALTTERGASQLPKEKFERVIIITQTVNQEKIDWLLAMQELWDLGLRSLGVLGGGQLVASLIELDLIDEIWLTVCPLILGGKNSPTPVDGLGLSQKSAKNLQLLAVKQVAEEVFLHYRVIRKSETNELKTKSK